MYSGTGKLPSYMGIKRNIFSQLLTYFLKPFLSSVLNRNEWHFSLFIYKINPDPARSSLFRFLQQEIEKSITAKQHIYRKPKPDTSFSKNNLHFFPQNYNFFSQHLHHFWNEKWEKNVPLVIFFHTPSLKTPLNVTNRTTEEEFLSPSKIRKGRDAPIEGETSISQNWRGAAHLCRYTHYCYCCDRKKRCDISYERFQCVLTASAL